MTRKFIPRIRNKPQPNRMKASRERYFPRQYKERKETIERELKYNRIYDMINKKREKLPDGRKLFYSEEFKMYILKAV
jgi:hypothetical protein